MKIMNSIKEDYHMHSFQYSDGLNSIDDIIKYTGDIGMKTIAITDHSQEALDKEGYVKKANRTICLERWKNVWNSVNVIFGIEGDLLNENGDICDHIQDKKGDFLLLSAHMGVYSGDLSKINKAYECAIKKHHKIISILSHPCSSNWGENLDIEKLISLANKYDIPMEFNCSNFVNGKTDLNKLDKVIRKANRIYVNSDAHSLNEIKENTKIGFDFLKNKYGI